MTEVRHTKGTFFGVGTHIDIRFRILMTCTRTRIPEVVTVSFYRSLHHFASDSLRSETTNLKVFVLSVSDLLPPTSL